MVRVRDLLGGLRAARRGVVVLRRLRWGLRGDRPLLRGRQVPAQAGPEGEDGLRGHRPEVVPGRRVDRPPGAGEAAEPGGLVVPGPHPRQRRLDRLDHGEHPVRRTAAGPDQHGPRRGHGPAADDLRGRARRRGAAARARRGRASGGAVRALRGFLRRREADVDKPRRSQA
ncbi:hypothetical protein FRIGORI9N_460027 [Frigoribacterium sp. 9N]|nr:hypothetical protein FRIGORI9N_460027 [Frigoribacterium sp. 9N]